MSKDICLNITDKIYINYILSFVFFVILVGYLLIQRYFDRVYFVFRWVPNIKKEDEGAWSLRFLIFNSTILTTLSVLITSYLFFGPKTQKLQYIFIILIPTIATPFNSSFFNLLLRAQRRKILSELENQTYYDDSVRKQQIEYLQKSLDEVNGKINGI